MQLALAQTDFTPSSVAEALAEIDKRAREAARAGAALIAFPELFMCGYLDADSARDLSLTAAVLARHLGEIARSHGLAICTGYSERDGDALYNAALLVGSGGEVLLNYRKMHLWGELEKSLFMPGEPSPVVEVQPSFFLGVLICYDLDFPVTMQDLQRRGAEMALVISATGRDYAIVPRIQAPARAYENSMFLAFCNRVDGAGDFAGESAVLAPDGSVLVRAADRREALLIAELDGRRWAGYRAAHRYVDDQRTDHFPLRLLPNG